VASARIEQECHPERSEGSLAGHRSFAALRMTNSRIGCYAGINLGETEQTMDNQTKTRTPGRYGIEEIESGQLEAWPNPNSERDYVTHLEIPEFTCLCPRSGFPDFATIIIDYVPDQYVVELKSLKLYINKYRNRQISHESATNTILDDLVTLLSPRWMRVVADFTVRGNIKTIIFAEQSTPGYQGPRPEYRRYLPANQ
jgi:7-cyano-7-deazaguanine reductase